MTEPTNEQIERAARDAGASPAALRSIRLRLANNMPETSTAGRSILAHARTIAEAEAREARLREALGKAESALRNHACHGEDAPCRRSKAECETECGYEAGVALAAFRQYLQENPDG